MNTSCVFTNTDGSNGTILAFEREGGILRVTMRNTRDGDDVECVMYLEPFQIKELQTYFAPQEVSKIHAAQEGIN